jgi:hypothetical protein
MITGESLGLVEEFLIRRRMGVQELAELPARKVDAFLILGDEMEREERDGKTEH